MDRVKEKRIQVKLWHKILLTVAVLMLVGGSLALVLQDNPRYASGQATAMVEHAYHWQYNSADLYSPLNEEYLGQGIWEVKSSGSYPYSISGGGLAAFRVYEETNTVKIYNAVAGTILNRREELELEHRREQQKLEWDLYELEQRLEELEKPPATRPSGGVLPPYRPPSSEVENPFR